MGMILARKAQAVNAESLILPLEIYSGPMQFNRIKAVFVILSLCMAAQAFSQTQTIDTEDKDQQEEDFDNKKWKDRIVVGGNIGAQFGSATYIEVSPTIGYRLTKSLTSGVGFTYQYFSENYNLPTFADYKASVTGFRIYSQYDLFFGFFAHAEYEYDWFKLTYEDATLGTYANSVPALFLGGGYNYMISPNAKFQIIALYDVLHTSESIYYNPLVFRIGFNVGL